MLRAVLVRTRGPRNAGLAARAAANFGPAELVFAAPERPDLLDDPDCIEMAHGVAKGARGTVVPSLDEALAACTHAVGFSARFRRHRRMRTLGEARDELRARAARRGERVALVFGNEIHGLSEAETAPLAELLWIPTSRRHTSLNLGTAVAIVLASLFDDAGAGSRALEQTRKGVPLQHAERARLVLHLREALVPRVRGDALRRELDASLERIFGRAALETRDARVWHKLLRELGGDWTPGL